MKGLPDLCRGLLKLYSGKQYKTSFGFVDNMRAIVDVAQEDSLWNAVVAKLSAPKVDATLLSPPALVDWERHGGFRLTRDRTLRYSVGLDDYRRTFKAASEISVERFKADRLEAYDDDATAPHSSWPIYRCLTVEVMVGKERFVCSGGDWYALKEDFAKRIADRVKTLPTSLIALPTASISKGKIEDEGAFNTRVVAASPSTLALMDKKLVKCAAAGSTVEVCDIFTEDGAFIHVKHRKGGSATLSHLFAQARISAESLVSDQAFRSAARAHLRAVGKPWEARIADVDFDARKHKVVLALLNCTPKELLNLPFFSQLNLVRTVEAISRLGYTVELLPIPAA